jgi:hypothetical protein
MGITSSLRQFLKGDAISMAFGEYESNGTADSVCFVRELNAAVDAGKVTAEHSDEESGRTWVVTKIAVAQTIDVRQFGVRGNALEQVASSLQASDDRAKSVQKTPWRVSLSAMKRRVASVEYIYPKSIPHMTVCIIILDNGYALQGMSAPADPENFNAEKGKEFAYEDAMRKMWPLEAYVMRDLLSGNIELNNPNERWGA